MTTMIVIIFGSGISVNFDLPLLLLHGGSPKVTSAVGSNNSVFSISTFISTVGKTLSMDYSASGDRW